MDKLKLRQVIKNKRKNMTENDSSSSSNMIKEKFLGLDLCRNKKNVLIYVSTKLEVGTIDLIKELLDRGVNVYTPRVINLEDGLMRFIKISSLNDLEVGCMNILEPKSNLLELDESKIDSTFLLVMPGLAFDKNGHRLGYGGGFYDRFCNRVTNDLLKVALSFDYQIVDSVSVNEFDVSVDVVITEKEIIRCK
jgi:5-formyltetrahydrofolate cyclo-ligase